MISKTANTIFTLILFCLNFVLTTGCSEDMTNDLLGRTPVKVSASFAPLDNGETRAATTLNTEQGFTVSSTAAYNQVRINVDNTDYVYSFSGTAGSSSTTLTTSGQPYFPAKVNAVDVYAHYPNVTLSNGSYAFTVQQDQTSTDDYLQSDLMTADCTQASRQLTNGSWQVTEAALRFKHQMAKIVIRARSEDTDYIKVNTVTLNRAKPTTTLTYQNGAYSVSAEATGTAANMPIITGSAHTTEQEGAVLIPPQTFTAGALVTVNVQYKDPAQEGSQWVARDLTFSFTDSKRFEGGCVYTMDITVGVEFVTLNNSNVDLTGWNTDDKQLWISPTITKSGLASLARIKSLPSSPTFTGGQRELDATQIVVEAKENIHSTSYSKTLKYTPDGQNGDFIVTYVNNIHAGTNTATVKIVGVNDYSGAIEAKFSILRKSITEEHVSIAAIPDQTYDGETKEPALTITDNESGTTNELHVNADYTVDYGSDNTNVGTKTVNITGIGDYQGSTSTTYNLVKASGGICTFTESALRYYLPTNRTETYTPVIATIDGDPTVTVTAASNNTSVAQPVSNSTTGAITIKGAGKATITLNVTGQNYEYTPQTMTVTVKQGPILPIMYVAPVNIGANETVFAVNNWSTTCCYMSWYEARFLGFDLYSLKKDGLTVDGKSYHIPSRYEWSSILPPEAGILDFRNELTVNDKSDANVKFCVESSHTNQSSDADYTHHVTAESGWTSDYKSMGDATADGHPGTAYALRFKNSDYCCAYRYDLIKTTSSNMWLTGNASGKTSLVIRVIYLGQSTSESIETIAAKGDDYWNSNTDFTVSLPVCGSNYAACNPGQIAYGTYQDNGYYISATVYSGYTHYSAIINVPWSTSHNNDYATYACYTGLGDYGINVRMFRDKY